MIYKTVLLINLILLKVRGQRKIGPVKYEKWKIPGQQREIPELSPKFQKLNLEQLKGFLYYSSFCFIHLKDVKSI